MGCGMYCADAADDKTSTLAIVAMKSRIPEGMIDITGCTRDSLAFRISQVAPKENRSRPSLLCKCRGLSAASEAHAKAHHARADLEHCLIRPASSFAPGCDVRSAHVDLSCLLGVKMTASICGGLFCDRSSLHNAESATLS
jgi:hypothetical protein